MFHRMTAAVVAATIVVCLPGVAAAQFVPGMGGFGGGNLAGTGTVTVQRPPAFLRMHIDLTAKGKTLEEALARLKDRREAALAQLETLQADKAATKVDPPRLSTGQGGQQAQFEAMIAQRMAQRGKKVPKGLKTPKPVVVAQSLSAQWSLPAGDAEKSLLAAQTIREKVKAAELAGAKEVEKPTPEEEEVQEEMAEMARNSGQEQPPAGEPQFVYVAKLAEADRQKGMADAFAKAKTQAEQLAKAAGITLGPMIGLSGQGGGGPSFDEDNSPYVNRYQRFLVQQAAEMASEGGGDEAIGSNPGSLNFHFTVTASFAIGK